MQISGFNCSPLSTWLNNKIIPKAANPIQPSTVQNKHGIIDRIRNYHHYELQRDINNKQGKMWICMDRKINPSGGKIYTFKFDAKYTNYDEYDKRTRELFPAMEMSPGHVQNIPNDFWFYLEKLGYAIRTVDGETYMDYPDRAALLSGWDQLRKERKDLPSLDLVSSRGIAGDIDFFKGYMSHDILLSDGAEFIHDHQYHVISILKLILIEGSHKKEQLLRRKVLKKCYQAAQNANLMINGKMPHTLSKKEIVFLKKYKNIYEKALGATTDYIFAADENIAKIIHLYERFFSYQVWIMPYWDNYMARCFPDMNAPPKEEMLRSIWSKISI